MIERWHRSLKAAIICHQNKNWVEILPTVLLGLRTSFKEDINASAAEMLYGTAIRLPGEFFVTVEESTDPQIFLGKFRQHIRQVKPSSVAHHNKPKIFVQKALDTCTHVFVRVDAVKKPLEAPYEGPFEIIERVTEHIYKINYKGREVNISVERLKPAFCEVSREDSVIEIPKTYSKKTVRLFYLLFI
ncbi:uncharacterized protein LOC123988532 [Osmia bicornis bicornis]|uniref:uncharacterized protein LOC123988532 n=1 Tax=Osmia bicornis bicornis TaxID=1437191 RepID=UPI001EAED64E|nr:uncharacterized protein LOC123988532 [Osmia bicornis bicornis]